MTFEHQSKRLLWLELQADFDLRIAKRMVGAQIDKQMHARAAWCVRPPRDDMHGKNRRPRP